MFWCVRVALHGKFAAVACDVCAAATPAQITTTKISARATAFLLLRDETIGPLLDVSTKPARHCASPLPRPPNLSYCRPVICAAAEWGGVRSWDARVHE